MRTLIYKRTHKGDPDASGHFGVSDCMGRVRGLEFDAVIGIGGTSDEPRSQDIAGKLNWIGIGPRRYAALGSRGPDVTFDHFVLFDDRGQEFRFLAPIVARRMYAPTPPRFLYSDRLGEAEQAEIECVLLIAKEAPASTNKLRRAPSRNGGCRPKSCRTRPIC